MCEGECVCWKSICVQYEKRKKCNMDSSVFAEGEHSLMQKCCKIELFSAYKEEEVHPGLLANRERLTLH